MVNIICKEMLAEEPERWEFEDGVDLRELIDYDNFPKMGEEDILRQNGVSRITEFIGNDDFSEAFVERQRYEVDAGRQEEPLLYQPLYDTIQDSNLPKKVDIYLLGPGGIIFQEIKEGGEVIFGTIGESTETVSIKQYAAGIEYTMQMVMYNETWNFSIVERAAGIAHNALMNHLHLYPYIDFTYAATNKTGASAVGADLTEKYATTIENAIVHSKQHKKYPRRGPYDLLISSSNMFTVEKALLRVQQQGFSKQSSALSMIRNIIVYDGATVTRGKETVEYTGVTAGKGYLISKQYKRRDASSWVKRGLTSRSGNPDISRFIEEQTVYDVHLGTYTNPLRSVEEITFPTS